MANRWLDKIDDDSGPPYTIKPAVVPDAPAPMREAYARAEIARVREELETQGWDGFDEAGRPTGRLKDLADVLEIGDTINGPIGVEALCFARGGVHVMYFSRWPRPPAAPPEPPVEDRIREFLHNRRYA